MSIHNLELVAEKPVFNQPINNVFSIDDYREELPQHITNYQIMDVNRANLGVPEVTKTGGHVYQELSTFLDTNGHTVTRPVTIGMPNSNLIEVSPYAVISSDPWITGPRGLNRIKTNQLVDLGFPVVWLHHADHHSALQPDKSVVRSARQAHALIDDLKANFEYDLGTVIVDGYSRGGMTGEKFIALADQHNTNVIFSIFDAPCFAVDMSQLEKMLTMGKQLPNELLGIVKVGINFLAKSVCENDLSDFTELARTFNPHPKNIIHEAMWAHALVNAQVGPILKHQPKDTSGVRNFFKSDEMSQINAYREAYDPLENVLVLAHEGAHVQGAHPNYLRNDRRTQFKILHEAVLMAQSPEEIGKIALQGIKSHYEIAA